MGRHTSSTHLFAEQLQKRLHDLFEGFNDSSEPIVLVFMHGSLAEIPDERASIKPLYFTHQQSFE